MSRVVATVSDGVARLGLRLIGVKPSTLTGRVIPPPGQTDLTALKELQRLAIPNKDKATELLINDTETKNLDLKLVTGM